MANRLFRCLAAFAIVITWCLSNAAVPARADTLSPGLHHFKFYLDPALLTDPQFARAALPKYVADMNTILAKNTRQQLVFDPETDIILAPAQPQSDTAASPLPTDGFEIWAYAVPSTSLVYGPFASVDTSGAAVLAGLKWTKLYDPDVLTTAGEAQDYTAQINTMLHEIAHVFGAGIGEYYSLWRVLDSTQAEPLLNINAADPADIYWSDKPDLMRDPLLQFTRTAARTGYLDQARYSDLTAAVVNGSYRNGVPVSGQFTVQVIDRNGLPVPSAEIKVWSVRASSPYTSQLLYDVMADQNGQASLLWGGTGSPRSSANMLRLIKVYKDGVPLTQPRYISVFDADIASLVRHQSVYTIAMQQANHSPVDLQLSNASIDENQPAGTLIGSLAGQDHDSGDALTYSFCGGSDDAAFAIANTNLLSAVSFDFETKYSYTICVAVSDGSGGSFDKSLVIAINDLPDGNSRARFRSQGAADGWVRESSRDSGKGGAVNAADRASLLGFDGAGREYRSVLSFDTSSLPDDAIITRVMLRVKQKDSSGEAAPLLIDMRKDHLGTSPMLQANDYQTRASVAGSPSIASVNGWYTMELDAIALGLVNLTGTTQLRLRLQPGLALSQGTMRLFTGNAITANRPQLVVEYYVP